MPPAGQDVARVFAITRRDRAQRGAGHHLGKADDRVERRAQFVADIREEARLDQAGVLRLGQGARQARVGAFGFAQARAQQRQRVAIADISPVRNHRESPDQRARMLVGDPALEIDDIDVAFHDQRIAIHQSGDRFAVE
jgi:hypothetical protein